MKSYPYSKQHIDSKDVKSVINALNSDIITGGSVALNFEKKISEYTGAKYAVTCSNGTAALHLVSMALNITHKDVVIVPTITFAATVNAFKINHAKILLCDVDSQTGLIGSKELEECINKNSHLNPTVLCAVHLNGQLCDVEKISKICIRKNIKLVFDASHALSANINGLSSSLNDYAECSTFSFHPVKTITTIEGGLVTTNKKELYEKLIMFRENGIERDKNKFKFASNAFDNKGNLNTWFYEVQETGLNYRLNDISCALGISQLEKIDMLQNRRKIIYNFYEDFFSRRNNIKPIKKLKNQTHGMHLYPILINFKKLRITRSELMNKLKEYNIFTQIHYIPMHFHPKYKINSTKITFKGSEKYYSQCLSIPLFPSMNIDDARYVANKIVTLVK